MVAGVLIGNYEPEGVRRAFGGHANLQGTSIRKSESDHRVVRFTNLSLSYPYRSPCNDVASSDKGPIRTSTNHFQETKHMAAHWDIYCPQLDHRTSDHARPGLGYPTRIFS
jgi:hypothetical protein